MKPIAITQGDPAGIGPEIAALCFLEQPELLRGCFVAGDVATLRRACAVLKRKQAVPVALIDSPQDAWTVPPRCVPVLQVVDASEPLPAWGRQSPVAGRAAAQAIIWAADAALRGEVQAVVTAPLNKESLREAGIEYPGHTELLQARAAAFAGMPVRDMPVRMMLANEELRTVLVSIHVSLRHAIEAVTRDAVLQTIQIAHHALKRALGREPRISVAGLNPHAGEGGLFGREELEIIAPAIGEARSQGIDVSGPYPPDTVFMAARQSRSSAHPTDAVVAMYHDQGLIPVKYLGLDQGVNVSLGLPFVRTSPDHGTAFDLAGTGRADPSSLVQAIRMAKRLSAGPAST